MAGVGRPKGLPKTGGRQPGTKNKRTKFLDDVLQDLGIDVVERLAEKLPKLPEKDQVIVLLKLLEFIYPKKQAISAEIREVLEPSIIKRMDGTFEELRIDRISGEQVIEAEDVKKD